MKLQLEKIELREIEMPLKTRFETSFGVTTKRRVIIIRVFDPDGASGWGECTAMEHPFYNHETVDTVWSIISKFVAPMMAAANVSSASEVGDALAAIQDNRMATSRRLSIFRFSTDWALTATERTPHMNIF